MNVDDVPSALIPDIGKLFQPWLVATHADTGLSPVNERIIDLLFDWLTRVEDAMKPLMVKDASQLPKVDLNFANLRGVREDLARELFRILPSETGSGRAISRWPRC